MLKVSSKTDCALRNVGIEKRNISRASKVDSPGLAVAPVSLSQSKESSQEGGRVGERGPESRAETGRRSGLAGIVHLD